MPKSNQSINIDLEELLSSKGYDVTTLDSSGKDVPVADDAELMSFHFHKDGKDYGTVTVTVDGLQKLTVYYDDEIANSGGTSDSDRGMDGTSWISLVKQLKKFAQQHQLGFVLKDTDRLRTDMKKRVHTKKIEESAQLKDDLEFMSESAFRKIYGVAKREFVAESEKNTHTSALGKALYRDLSKEKKASPAQVQRNKERWAKRQAERDQGVAEGSSPFGNKCAGPFASEERAKREASRISKELGVKRYVEKTSDGKYIVVKKQGVAEGSETVTTKKTSDGREIFWVEMNHKNPARSMDGIGRPDNGTEGRSVGYVTRDDQGRWREMTSDVGRVPYEFGNESYPESMNAEQVFMRIKQRLARGGTQVRPIADHPSKQMKLDEGYYGNRKMSYSDDTPTVKMVIKHNRQLEETDQRFRYIESIFLETSDGERFKAPTNKPSRARAFARHIAEGGSYKDDRWDHITEMCEDIDKMGGFVRATRNKREQFNESAQRMISEATEQYEQLKETIKRISSSKGYNKYFESYEPRVISEDEGDLAEAFMHSSIDTRIESALPTLSKFGIKMSKITESDMFAEWADSIVDESLELHNPDQVDELVELLSNEFPVGPNAEVAIAELQDIIEDEGLYGRLRLAAKADANSDANPEIIAWMQEQDNQVYRDVLEKINSNQQPEEPESEVPAEAPPAPQEQPPSEQDAEEDSLPPVPQSDDQPPADDTEGELPPLPPLAEGDEALASFKRLLGL